MSSPIPIRGERDVEPGDAQTHNANIALLQHVSFMKALIYNGPWDMVLAGLPGPEPEDCNPLTRGPDALPPGIEFSVSHYFPTRLFERIVGHQNFSM